MDTKVQVGAVLSTTGADDVLCCVVLCCVVSEEDKNGSWSSILLFMFKLVSTVRGSGPGVWRYVFDYYLFI